VHQLVIKEGSFFKLFLHPIGSYLLDKQCRAAGFLHVVHRGIHNGKQGRTTDPHFGYVT